MHNITLLTHELDVDQKKQLDRAICHFHDVQRIFILEEYGTCNLPTIHNRVVCESFINLEYKKPYIVITGLPFNDNWYSHVFNGCSLITLSGWMHAFFDDKSRNAVASPDASILMSLTLTSSLLISNYIDYEFFHDQTKGCLFDFCKHKPDRSFKMRTGYICDECLDKLAVKGISSIEVEAIYALLDRVRHLVLGRHSHTTKPNDFKYIDDEFLSQCMLSEKISIPPQLIESLKNNKLCVFVGSGLSLQRDVKVDFNKNLNWNSLPSWSEVPVRMSELVEKYVGKEEKPRKTDSLDEFLSDLDYFRNALGTDLYYSRAIKDIFYPKVIDPGRANRLIYRFPINWVLTTNYDSILEYAAPPGTCRFTWRESIHAREFLKDSEDRKPILKLHGCASRPDTIVLTSLEYERIRNNMEYLSLLRFVFDCQSILFIGFGFSDPFDLDMALREASYAGAAAGEKFAILPKTQRTYIREKFPQIQQISYESHDTISEILGVLIQETN